jgi:quercetin dioxygenase-like cupin family protein
MGHFVAEIGPLSLRVARTYELTVGDAKFGPDAINLPHTHPGPEAWYVLAGSQCLELANGRTIRARSGQAAIAPADTPMKLTFFEQRDALLMVVSDADRPWSSPSAWKPNNLCETTMRH